MKIECKSNSQLSLSEWYEIIFLDRMKIGMIFDTKTITVIFRRRKFFFFITGVFYY
jgi:hypothetical protein